MKKKKTQKFPTPIGRKYKVGKKTVQKEAIPYEPITYSYKKKSKDLPTKVIEIPHLKFTVLVKDMEAYKKAYPEGEIKGGAATFRTDKHEITIFITDMAKSTKQLSNAPIIAHECLHVIQLISAQYGMSIEHEMEHSAYLLYYLIEEIIQN